MKFLRYTGVALLILAIALVAMGHFDWKNADDAYAVTPYPTSPSLLYRSSDPYNGTERYFGSTELAKSVGSQSQDAKAEYTYLGAFNRGNFKVTRMTDGQQMCYIAMTYIEYDSRVNYPTAIACPGKKNGVSQQPLEEALFTYMGYDDIRHVEVTRMTDGIHTCYISNYFGSIVSYPPSIACPE